MSDRKTCCNFLRNCGSWLQAHVNVLLGMLIHCHFARLKYTSIEPLWWVYFFEQLQTVESTTRSKRCFAKVRRHPVESTLLCSTLDVSSREQCTMSKHNDPVHTALFSTTESKYQWCQIGKHVATFCETAGLDFRLVLTHFQVCSFIATLHDWSKHQ